MAKGENERIKERNSVFERAGSGGVVLATVKEKCWAELAESGVDWIGET